MIFIFGIIRYTNSAKMEEGDQMKTNAETLKTATFAGGCFWCVESDFGSVEGVVEVVSGYTGGTSENADYEAVTGGKTGHLEAVQVIYDPSVIGYTELLDIFWKHIDPTDPGGQFVDRGSQYRTAVFYHGDEQKRMAETSKSQLNASGRFSKPVATEIFPLDKFYPAEAYHQNFHKKSPVRYKLYRYNSGRDQFLKKVWEKPVEKAETTQNRIYSKPSEEEIKNRLTPLQYKVTQKEGTEPPFDNAYWNNKQSGIYVDIVSGEPLFSSLDKFDSGTGWPSFTKPLEPDNIVEKNDNSLFMVRTEVRSRLGDSHLGHVFSDGPPPTGLRYCMNSAALRFVPEQDLEKEGYGVYSILFD